MSYFCVIAPGRECILLKYNVFKHPFPTIYDMSFLQNWRFFIAVLSAGFGLQGCNSSTSEKTKGHLILEINQKEIPVGKKPIAIIGALIIDGNGGKPIADVA